MTEEELKALIGGMDKREPIAPRPERVVPQQSARTPSMLVRQAMMGAGSDDATADAVEEGASEEALDTWADDDAAETAAFDDDGQDDWADADDEPSGPLMLHASEVEAAASDEPDREEAENDGTEDLAATAEADAWDDDETEDVAAAAEADAWDEDDGDDWAEDASASVDETPDEAPRVSLRVSHADAWAEDADDDADEDDDDWTDDSDDATDVSTNDAHDPDDTPRERVSLRMPRPETSRDEGLAADSADDNDTDDEDAPVRLRSRGLTMRRAEVAPDALRATARDDEQRKPRIMLMGEFSAGKSTLMNLLLGEPALPVNATATQLPPVWISKGSDPQPMRVDLEGFEEPVDLTAPGIPLADTHYIRLQKEADLLDICDLIDTPGISDPNMPAEIWQRMIQHADIIIWCTHATQAWRQSEAAAWALMPQKLQSRSLLLLTRFDKVANDRDRIRVLKRVRSETDTLFRDIFPISLTEAIAAGDDKDAFAAAGGESFADALFEVIGLIQRRDATVRTRPRSQLAPFRLDPEPEPVRVITPRRVRPRPLAARPLGSRSGAFGDRG